MECNKRMFSIFPQLLDHVVLSGKDVNDILATSLIGDPLVKKPRTWLSLVNILNPHSISLTMHHTRGATRTAETMINIQDNPEPDTTTSTTIIIEKPHHPHNPHHHRKT
jgi:hypothetical protein